MKRFIAIWLLIGTTISVAETNSIIGHWTTDEVLSQLGPSITQYIFLTNDVFRLKTEFSRWLIPTMRAEGKYQILGNQVILFGPHNITTNNFSFDGATLVIEEQSGDVFRLIRKDINGTESSVAGAAPQSAPSPEP